mgnify:CR=1 FL=1
MYFLFYSKKWSSFYLHFSTFDFLRFIFFAYIREHLQDKGYGNPFSDPFIFVRTEYTLIINWYIRVAYLYEEINVHRFYQTTTIYTECDLI